MKNYRLKTHDKYSNPEASMRVMIKASNDYLRSLTKRSEHYTYKLPYKSFILSRTSLIAISISSLSISTTFLQHNVNSNLQTKSNDYTTPSRALTPKKTCVIQRKWHMTHDSLRSSFGFLWLKI